LEGSVDQGTTGKDLNIAITGKTKQNGKLTRFQGERKGKDQQPDREK